MSDRPALTSSTPSADPARAPHDEISAWTIPLMCAGIAVIAACLIIPAADENRRLVYEREKLKIDLEHIEKQVAINEEFLRRVADDPTLLERLAQRQMKMVREGTNILELKTGATPQQMSPFPLVTIPPPDPLPPYQATGGRFANFCRHPRSRLILLGSGLLLIASGLVLGHTRGGR
jgi:hypothetical protein